MDKTLAVTLAIFTTLIGIGGASIMIAIARDIWTTTTKNKE